MSSDPISSQCGQQEADPLHHSIFPHPDTADQHGIVCVGADLSVELLLDAYGNGIFPWPHWDMLLWFSPDPRCMLFPGDVRVTKSMKRILRSGRFTITFDRAFTEVIQACGAAPRAEEDGTWILPEMIEAYCRLHDEGYAHSVEAWLDDELAGGLYGVSLGRAFFGESMFSSSSNASKACFITLARQLEAWNFDFIDCQLPTDHLLTLGAQVVPRATYLSQLKETMKHDTRRGSWIGLHREETEA